MFVVWKVGISKGCVVSMHRTFVGFMLHDGVRYIHTWTLLLDLHFGSEHTFI